MLHKGEQHLVERLGADLRAEPIERAGHDFRVELLPVARDQNVAGLVDQAHRVERPGMNGQLGMLFNVAHLVHAMRKLAARRHVGKNDVPVIGEEGLGELIAFPGIPRNMKFHHVKISSRKLPSSSGNRCRTALKICFRRIWRPILLVSRS